MGPGSADRTWWPGAAGLARACVWAGAVWALTNAIAITLTVPLPRAGVGLRLHHHVFDAIETLGLCLFASGLARLAALVPDRGRRSPPGRALLGAACHTALALGCVSALLGPTMQRPAVEVATRLGLGVPGPGLTCVRAALLLLCALALTLACIVGTVSGRRPRLAPVAILLGLGGLVVNRLVLTDAYEEIHLAIAWASVSLLGTTLAARAAARARDAAEPAASALPGWRWAAGAACVVSAWVVEPSNAVRLELFKERGAAAEFLLAQVRWRMPTPPSARPARPDAPAPGAAPAPALPLPEAPVVVLVTLDAVRGDLLTRDVPGARLPTLTRLRAGGACFTRAIAPGSQTSTSLASLFTSRYSSQLRWDLHGAGLAQRHYPAVDPTPRFPELLRARGVRTVAVVSPGFLASRFGVLRGFSEEVVVAWGHARAAEIVEPLLAKLEAHGPGPGLFFAHFMDAHEPYDRGARTSGTPFERYVSEVEVLDAALGRIAELLERKHARRAYLIVSADHGEAFGEHGTTFHSKTLYQELLHVPLVLWGPGIPARTIDERVGLIDVGATVLELFRAPPQPEGMAQSLLPLVVGQGDHRRTQPLAAEGRLARAFFTTQDLKVIEDARHKTVEVYDLVADPRELHDLFDGDPDRAAGAVAQSRAFFAKHALRAPGYEPPYKR